VILVLVMTKEMHYKEIDKQKRDTKLNALKINTKSVNITTKPSDSNDNMNAELYIESIFEQEMYWRSNNARCVCYNEDD
jgi:hypothetical protein